MTIRKKVSAVILAAVLSTPCLVPVYAANSYSSALEDMNAELDETQSDLEDVQSRISDLESKKGKAEAYLTELNSQISDLTSQLEELQNEFADNQRKLDTTSQELMDAKSKEKTQREDMALRIQYMYEESAGESSLAAILSTGNFVDLLDAASNITQLEDYDRKALQEYADTCTVIENKQTELQQENDKLEKLTTAASAKKQEILTLYNDTKGTVASYKEQLEGEKQSQSDLLESIAEQQSEIQEMQISVAREVAAADAAARAAAAEKARTEERENTDMVAAENSGSTSSSAEEFSSGDVQADVPYTGAVLTRAAGRIQGPSGGETYYNLDMSGVVKIMRAMGNTDKYWVRADGVKMLGDYVMVAANLSVHPRGSIVQSSLGKAIVVDTGGFATKYPKNLDIATNW